MTNKQIFESVASNSFRKLQELISKGYEETTDFTDALFTLSVDLENTARIIFEEKNV